MKRPRISPDTPWRELPHALMIPEVGIVLRVSRQTAYDLVNSGAIRAVQTTRCRRIVPKHEVARFLRTTGVERGEEREREAA